MFELTSQQIEQIKNSFLKAEIQNLTLKSSGEYIPGTNVGDNIVKFSILFKDDANNPKIFDSKYKDKLITRTFPIFSGAVEEQLKIVQTITECNKILQDNSINYIDIYPAVDYKGDKNKESHVSGKDLNLIYDVTFNIDQQDINDYLKVGIITFIDHLKIAEELKISPEVLNQEIYCSYLQIEDIIGNQSLVDLRVAGSVFDNKKAMNEVFNYLDFNVEQKKFAKVQQNIKKAFFSKLFYSRDNFSNANLLFYLDYNNLVKNESFYANLLSENTEFSNLITNSSISSIKFVRREYENSYLKNKKPKLKNSSVESIGDTVDILGSLQTKNTQAFYIAEYPKFEDKRTFMFVDKTAFFNNNTIYEYGIQLKINDGLYTFLDNKRDAFIANLNIFKQYFSYTEIPEYYDNTLNKFKDSFLPVYRTISSDLKRAYSTFIDTLKLFGLLKKITPQFNICIDNLISRFTASSDTLLYFINLYDQAITAINQILKNNANNIIEVEKWFGYKNGVDTSERPSIGYSFLDRKSQQGMYYTNTNYLKQRISEEKKRFLKNETVTNNVENYLAPLEVSCLNTKINLSNLDRVNEDDYVDIETDIRTYNKLSSRDESSFDINLSPIQTKQNFNTKVVNNDTFSFFSSHIQNLSNPLDTKTNIYEYGTPSESQKNTAIIPNYLLLSMMKKVKHKDFPSVLQFKFFDNLVLASTPFQVAALYKNETKIFNSTNFFTDIKLNSKFLLLFNTIHKIEYLQDPIKNLWVPLDINKLTYRNVLCRVVAYNDTNLQIDSYEEIKLPIYDKYFMLINENLQGTVQENIGISQPAPDVASAAANVMQASVPQVPQMQNNFSNLAGATNIPSGMRIT